MALTAEDLQIGGLRHLGTGGASSVNKVHGFQPAFKDRDTGAIYPSRHANGTLASVHLLDGLPSEVVVERSSIGRVAAVKSSLVAGFLLGSQFYTREEAVRKVAELERTASAGTSTAGNTGAHGP